MTSQPQLRIGHDERETAQRSLDQHLAAGRLDPDEYADRFARIGVARYAGELDELFSDLPGPDARGDDRGAGMALDAGGRRGGPDRWDLGSFRGLVPAVLVAAGVLLTIFFSLGWIFWLIVPAIFWGGGCSSGRRRGWHMSHRRSTT